MLQTNGLWKSYGNSMVFYGSPMDDYEEIMIVIAKKLNFFCLFKHYTNPIYGILYGRKLHFYALADA